MALCFRLDEILAVKVLCMGETETTWLFSGKVSVKFRFNNSIVFLTSTHVSLPLASHIFLSLAFHPLLFHYLPVTALTQTLLPSHPNGVAASVVSWALY